MTTFAGTFSIKSIAGTVFHRAEEEFLRKDGNLYDVVYDTYQSEVADITLKNVRIELKAVKSWDDLLAFMSVIAKNANGYEVSFSNYGDTSSHSEKGFVPSSVFAQAGMK